MLFFFFFFQAEDGIRDGTVTGVQTCALPISHLPPVIGVHVTNVGSKPVMVQGVAVQRKKGFDPSHYFFPCDIPKMLARGKSFEEVLDRTGWLPLNTKRIYVWDSTGAHWHMPRKELRRLLDSYQRWHRVRPEPQGSRSEGLGSQAGS